jgi:hypothetical protein
MTDLETLEELRRIDALETKEATEPSILGKVAGTVSKYHPGVAAIRGLVGSPEARQRTGEFVAKAAIPAALTAGAAFATGGASIPVQLAATGAAGWLGGRANELMGLNQPSGIAGQVGDIAASAIPGGVGRAVNKLKPFVGQKGEILANKAAVQEITTTLEGLNPKGGQAAVQKAFTEAKAIKAPIPTTNLGQAIDEAQKELYDVATPSAKTGFKDVEKRIRDFKELITYNPNGIKPAVMQKELEALGDLTSKLQKEGGSGAGLIAKLNNAFTRDLEVSAALGNQGAVKLLGARRDYQRLQTVTELKDELNNSFKFLHGEGLDKQLAGQTFLKKIENPDIQRQFQKAFSPVEQQDILRVAKIANEVPKITAKDTLSSWTARVVGSSVAGGALGYAGIGGGRGSIIGGLGAVAGVEAIVQGRRVVASLKSTMQTKAGRDMVDQLQKSGIFTKLAGALGAATAAQTKGSIQFQLEHEK